MKRILLFAALAMSVGASAQDPGRLARIWGAADERIGLQSDLWFEVGDYPRAVQLLYFRAQMHPRDYDAQTDLGWMLENIGRWAEALAVYERFHRRYPKDPDSALPLATFYFRKKLYAKVPPLLEPSIGKKPHPNAFRTLAHSYERLGMLKDSRRVWEAYLKLRPDDDPARNNLRRVQSKLSPTRR